MMAAAAAAGGFSLAMTTTVAGGGRLTKKMETSLPFWKRFPSTRCDATAAAAATTDIHVVGEDKSSAKVSSISALEQLKASGADRYTKERSSIAVIGLSIHTAPVEMREKLAVPEAQWSRAIAELCDLNHIEEAAVLSTCNRMEIYVVALSWHRGIREVTDWMAKACFLFGFTQHIPDSMEIVDQVTMQGRIEVDWGVYHAKYITQWQRREHTVTFQIEPPTRLEQYMAWYWSVTKRWIITAVPPPVIAYRPRGQIERRLVSTCFGIRNQLRDARSEFSDYPAVMGRMASMEDYVTEAIHSLGLQDPVYSDEAEPPAQRYASPLIEVGAIDRIDAFGGLFSTSPSQHYSMSDAFQHEAGPSQVDEMQGTQVEDVFEEEEHDEETQQRDHEKGKKKKTKKRRWNPHFI